MIGFQTGFKRIIGLSITAAFVSSSTIYSDYLSPNRKQLLYAYNHPGVYVWGPNHHKLIDANNQPIHAPKLMPFFNGIGLRWLQFATTHAAAIDANGDLFQWSDLSKSQPMITLKGKNLVKVVCLDESVIALGRNGSLYHLSSPELGPKGWTSNLHGMIHYPKDMGWFEKVIDISAGKNHALAVSNSNNVFSCSSNENGNQFGQLGIKGESQPGQLSRIPFFKDLDIAKAVAGFNHSLVVTKDGRIFGFGSNSLGQLGLDDLLIGEKIESPLEVKSVWSMDGKSSKPINMKCTDIAAGGDTSIFVINTLDEKQFEPIKSSVYSCGSGQYGQLGNGGFFHAGIRPSLLKPLSGLQEYNETLQKSTPIHLESITIGPTHGVGILKNMNSEYGKTTLFWGHQHAILRADKKKSHCPTPIEGVPLTSPVADETFQLAPLHLTKFVNGSRKADQGIAIGVFDTAIYSKVY